MPVITNFEDKIIQLLRRNKYGWFTTGVNLGGVTGASGGTGGPPGGFIGQLRQNKVTYDTTEAEEWTVPISGESLVTNLNRIRYRLGSLEAGNLSIEDEGIEVASGVTVMNFIGSPVTVTLASGYSDKVNITISGTGGGVGSGVVKVSTDDTTANYLENKLTAASSKITVTTAYPGGNEERQVDLGTVVINDLNDATITSPANNEILGYTGGKWVNRTLSEAGISPSGHTHTESDITDLVHDAVKIQSRNVSSTAPSDGESLAWSTANNQWEPTLISGGSGGSLEVQENSTQKVTNATILNFEGGATVTDEGSGKATILISGGSGGSSYTFVFDDVTSQIPATGNNFTTAATPISGSLVIHYNGLTQQPNNYNLTASGFHTLFSPVDGDELVAEYYTDVPSENILALTLDVEDTGTPVATNVEVLNFEGMDVSVNGSTVTVRGGGNLVVEDVTSQIPATGNNFTISGGPFIDGTLSLFYNGLFQQPNNFTETSATAFHTLFSPVSGDELIAQYAVTSISGSSSSYLRIDGTNDFTGGTLTLKDTVTTTIVSKNANTDFDDVLDLRGNIVHILGNNGQELSEFTNSAIVFNDPGNDVDFRVESDTDPNALFVQGSDGKVGVGEPIPDYKLDINGDFGFAPGSSVTPVDNGDIVIEATNNTTLTFKLKGSDGVVRSGTITLA